MRNNITESLYILIIVLDIISYNTDNSNKIYFHKNFIKFFYLFFLIYTYNINLIYNSLFKYLKNYII